MATEYKYEGETFLLDDSKGCYAEVTYKDQVGYVGVNLQGTPGTPYSWRPELSQRVTPEGLTRGISSGGDFESNLHALCTEPVRRQREAEAHKRFDPEAACKSLHEFVEKLL